MFGTTSGSFRRRNSYVRNDFRNKIFLTQVPLGRSDEGSACGVGTARKVALLEREVAVLERITREKRRELAGLLGQ